MSLVEGGNTAFVTSGESAPAQHWRVEGVRHKSTLKMKRLKIKKNESDKKRRRELGPLGRTCGTFNNHGKRHKVSCGYLSGTLRPPSTTSL